MKQAKQNWEEYRLLLVNYVGRSDAWGTDLGARVFTKINLDLMALNDGTLVLIDFTGLERSDVSFQREAVVETIRKHRPKLLFVVVNLSDDDLRLNLEVALDRRGDVLLWRASGGPQVLGRELPPEHRRTLERVWHLGETTSAKLVSVSQASASKKTKANVADQNLSTASSRLIALWKAGVVARVEGSSPSGGREHRYFAFG